MITTKHSFKSDKEFVRELLCADNLSEREFELVQRMEVLLEQVDKLALEIEVEVGKNG